MPLGSSSPRRAHREPAGRRLERQFQRERQRVTGDITFYVCWTDNDGLMASGKELVDWLFGEIHNGT